MLLLLLLLCQPVWLCCGLVMGLLCHQVHCVTLVCPRLGWSLVGCGEW